MLGVYPWSRLLPTGQPEPLHVLDSCRIRVGEVLRVDGDALVVRTDTLGYPDGRLELEPVAEATVGWRVDGGDFLDGPPDPGELVALHWGFACDRLAPDQAERLDELTRHQLELTNRRLA